MLSNYGVVEVKFEYKGDFFPIWTELKDISFSFFEKENPFEVMEDRFKDFQDSLIFEANIFTYGKKDYLNIIIKPKNFNVFDGYLISYKTIADEYRINGIVDFDYVCKQFKKDFSVYFNKITFKK